MIGIIGAMEDEVTLLKNNMEHIQKEVSNCFDFYEGELEDKPVVLLQCGIGKVNAGVGCALLIDRYKPSLVINTGSAGGIDPSLHVGDAVISDGLVYHDVDVTGFNYVLGQVPGCPAVFPVQEKFIACAEQAVDALKAEGVLPASFTHVRGLIGSGDIFMHKEAPLAAVRKNFPAMKAVEMEGAAIAQVCYLFKVPYLIIRALSDIAGAESPVAFDQFLPIASKHSAEIVKRLVKGL
jgi:adenosylhomocysteine nucleosidase